MLELVALSETETASSSVSIRILVEDGQNRLIDPDGHGCVDVLERKVYTREQHQIIILSHNHVHAKDVCVRVQCVVLWRTHYGGLIL